MITVAEASVLFSEKCGEIPEYGVLSIWLLFIFTIIIMRDCFIFTSQSTKGAL